MTENYSDFRLCQTTEPVGTGLGRNEKLGDRIQALGLALLSKAGSFSAMQKRRLAWAGFVLPWFRYLMTSSPPPPPF